MWDWGWGWGGGVGVRKHVGVVKQVRRVGVGVGGEEWGKE